MAGSRVEVFADFWQGAVMEMVSQDAQERITDERQICQQVGLA